VHMSYKKQCSCLMASSCGGQQAAVDAVGCDGWRRCSLRVLQTQAQQRLLGQGTLLPTCRS
jgi:hypothetical protein